MTLVHWCDFAQQPDIHIACDDTWSTPRWGGHEKHVDAEFEKKFCQADTGHVYVWGNDPEQENITCPECKKLYETHLEKQRIERDKRRNKRNELPGLE